MLCQSFENYESANYEVFEYSNTSNTSNNFFKSYIMSLSIGENLFFTNEELIGIYNKIPQHCELHNLKNCLRNNLNEPDDVFVLVIKDFFNIIDEYNNSETKEIIYDLLKIFENKNSNIEINQNDIINKVNFIDDKFYISEFPHNNGYPNCKNNIILNGINIYNIAKFPGIYDMKYYIESLFLEYINEISVEINNSNDNFVKSKRNNLKNIFTVIGKSLNIDFSWFFNSIKCSDSYSLTVDHGDLIILSEYAYGKKKDKNTKLYIRNSIGI